MRIHLKSKAELDQMRDAGLVAAEILEDMCQAAKPGVSTWELDQIARKAISKHKVVSAFLGYHGYPAVVCTSINEVVVHGSGRQLHEDPQVPNFTDDGRPGSGNRMKTGLVIAVEPMVNAGTPEVEVLDDNWTAVTKDRSMSAHFEHTIAITDDGPWVLTKP